MEEERKLKILENYRVSLDLFKDEGSKASFFKTYDLIDDETLLDIEQTLDKIKSGEIK